MAIKSIFHVNVNCSDLERSKAFYERLGFQTVNELPTGGSPKLALGLGLPNCEGRATIMILDPGQPQQARLDLIEWVEPRDPEAPYSHLFTSESTASRSGRRGSTRSTSASARPASRCSRSLCRWGRRRASSA